jgi:hypothetical protein
MEHMKDPKITYIETLTEALDKLRKALPSKKFKDLQNMCSSAIEQIKTDAELDANKYFIIFKLSLETKLIKILEISLYYI